MNFVFCYFPFYTTHSAFSTIDLSTAFNFLKENNFRVILYFSFTHCFVEVHLVTPSNEQFTYNSYIICKCAYRYDHVTCIQLTIRTRVVYFSILVPTLTKFYSRICNIFNTFSPW